MEVTNKKLVVAVIGYTGGVGSCLLAAMKRIGLLPHALVRSSTMKIGCGVSEEVPVDYGALSSYLLKEGGIPVIADVTASSDVQENYEGWLKQGISVVAANKGIFAGPEAKYRALLEAAKEGRCRLLHETTVGAGTSANNNDDGTPYRITSQRSWRMSGSFVSHRLLVRIERIETCYPTVCVRPSTIPPSVFIL